MTTEAVNYVKVDVCPGCHVSLEQKRCFVCDGDGSMTTIDWEGYTHQWNCPLCDGKGYVLLCKNCHIVSIDHLDWLR